MRDLNEKCGIFGIFGEQFDVSRLSFYGLFALQHRGQEATGIAVSDGNRIDCFKDTGLVNQVYSEDIISSMQGFMAIGHVLYTTCKRATAGHIQPITPKNSNIALVHNGNLPSTRALEAFLKSKNINLENMNDSEMMAEAINHYVEQGFELEDAVKKSYPLFTGGFSVLVMNNDSLVAIRDEYGVRPFSIGKLEDGYVFSSESCSFNTISAELLREVMPGEMVVVNKRGIRSEQLSLPKPKIDIFEFVYFARPDSTINGKLVHEVRNRTGLQLADEYPLDVDMVVPVPDTAIPAASSYARKLNIPFEMALIKNRYIQRTFIQPNQRLRKMGVKMKLNTLDPVIQGKRIALIDDSIVRGTTSQQIVQSLYEAGAKEVHFLVCSPPVRFPDFYGVDTPKQDKLIAATKSLSEIREFIGATSMYYLSLDGLISAIGLARKQLCTSCFTGEYPIHLHERDIEVKFDLKHDLDSFSDKSYGKQFFKDKVIFNHF